MQRIGRNDKRKTTETFRGYTMSWYDLSFIMG